MRSIFDVIPSTDDDVIDLISLEDLKIELGITVETEDESLQARITRESGLIAEFCGRTFALTEGIETFILDARRDSCISVLDLRVYPVRSVVSVVQDGTALIEGEDFEIDNEEGRLFRLGCHWGLDGWDRWGGESSLSRVAVTYSGGYQLPDEAPAGLAAAVIEAVRFRRISVNRDPSIRELSHEGVITGFFSEAIASGGFDKTVADLLAPFKRPVFA